MDGVGAGALAGGKHLFRIEIGFGGGAAVEGDGRVGLPHKGRAGVAVRVHGNRADAHVMRRADDPPGNLAPIGDEQATNGLNRVSWHGGTSWFVVGGCDARVRRT